jgi:hypothetical protein
MMDDDISELEKQLEEIEDKRAASESQIVGECLVLTSDFKLKDVQVIECK